MVDAGRLVTFGGAEQAFGFVQGEMPGVAGDEIATAAGWVWPDTAWAKEYPYTLGAQRFDAPPERLAAGKRGVDER